MFEVTLADGRTVLAEAYGPEDLALILQGTGATFNKEISNPNAQIFKTNEAVTMRQALRIVALEALVAEQNESKHLDGLNSDFAQLHEDLNYGEADMLSEDQLKAAAGCVLALMRIQNALNSSPKWNADTLDAVAAEVRATGLPLLDAEDALLSAEELAQKYAGEDGSWGQHPVHRRSDWREEVANDDTLQGYWSWVVSKLEEE